MQGIFTSKDACQTMEIARLLAKQLTGGEVIAMTGGLGSGKTHFVKGIAQGLGIEDRVTSPTFSILHEYEGGRLKLLHFDMYRITASELEDVGYYDAISSGGVTAIEWSENIHDFLPKDSLFVHISTQEDGSRTIEIKRGQL